MVIQIICNIITMIILNFTAKKIFDNIFFFSVLFLIIVYCIKMSEAWANMHVYKHV